MTKWTYEKAGVSVEAGYDAVKRMKKHASRTITQGVLEGLGSFGGLFELPTGYKEPVLVSGTDSVGSKVQVAFEMNIHNTIGIDCVAMCVNDIICMGAKPMYFLDYIGIGGLDPKIVELLVEGVSEGCVLSGSALIGGETWELSDIYKPGEYDLVGFSVGIVEKSKIITGKDIKSGDVLIGIASSGIHSNGYTLARKLAEAKNIKYGDYIDRLGKTLGEEFLTPTKIYAKLISLLLENYDIKGIANITGGGWIENIPRMFATYSLKAVVSKNVVPIPEIFNLIQEWGNVDEYEMYKTFNMGVGMVLCVSESEEEAVLKTINSTDEKAYKIGHVEIRLEDEENIVIV
ncbi:MAG: phosphoribosylformylglycinamidine cyclo-ligase [Oscillospiraceae bacterium]|jgi:phosphoribosylformylglycinamidine cyclo-ligase|nr:phosphoribosylformylglycinamidine cyclo-ligase [Oscillospiraceae bacterium]